MERVAEILDRTGGAISVYSGDDGTAREAILAGARGDISVTANVAPRLMHEMCMLALGGDREGALAVDERLMPLHKALFVESNPIPVKWALHEMGLIPEGIRLPLTPLSEGLRPVIREALAKAGLL